MIEKLLLYSDGGARGNPGPAASAYVATTPTGVILKSDAHFVGNRTNNQAEYEALIMALRYASELKAEEITCYLDSELVAKQLTGRYQVKNEQLHQLYREVKKILCGFKKVSFVNVPRENPMISQADALVNKTLDAQALSGSVARLQPMQGVFVHVSIRTSNIVRSIDFYQRFLGLRVVGKFEYKAANSELVFMQDQKGKGAMLELTFCRGQSVFEQPSFEKRLFDHLGFEVPDVYVAVAEMKRAGVVVKSEPTKFDESTTIAFVEDPDGTLVELIERR